jgi:hypothetical protein
MSESNKRYALLNSTAIHLLLLAAVALLIYSNTFHAPFIFDDESSITQNYTIRNLSNFLYNHIGYKSIPNRYIGYLTFALNYRFGGLNEVGYHVVNLAIHIANGLLVYALVRMTLRTPFFVQRSTFDVKNSDSAIHNSQFTIHNCLPLLAALLFVCHPIQTQAVTYIVQRLTSLATLFFLSSLVLHIRWRLSREDGHPFISWEVSPYWLLSLLSAILAMKTKEIAFTLPMIVLLYEFSFFGKPTLLRMKESGALFLTICIIPITVFTMQGNVAEFLTAVNKVTMGRVAADRWEYLYTQFSAIVTYLRLLLFPVSQNLDYDYPINHSLLDPRAFLSLALLLAILVMAVWLYYRSSFKIQIFTIHYSRLIAFGILWFFITLSVESSLMPLPDIIFEHRSYLPSVGFFISVAVLIVEAIQKLHISSVRKLAGCSVIGLLLIFSVATYMRNGVWQNWETMWSDVAIKSPQKPRAFNNLGSYYCRHEKVNEAVLAYETALKLDPLYRDALFNLSLVYITLGRKDDVMRTTTVLQRYYPESFWQLQDIIVSK